jgi:ankyrin repeat protein
LLARGADLKATDNQGQSPLHVAPTKDAAELLLARGAAVNAKRTDGATPLHLAAVYGRADVVKILLARGADVNVQTKDGVSPLHYAKGTEVVKLLLASGANVDATDSGGNTPLYMADEAGVVDLLLAQGATLNAKNNIEQTPLLRVVRTYISNLPAHGLMSGPLGDPIVVAHGGSIEVIKALLDRGADVNSADREGFTPLFYVREAIKNRSYDEVRAQLKAVESSLLAHGAKLEKIKKESVDQPQTSFPAELAGIPQLELGTRVMMQIDIVYEERKRSGKENHLYYRESSALTSSPGNLTFDDHLQLLNHFQSLPADVQKNGLWIKRMAKQSWTQPDLARAEELTQHARSRSVSLYLCEPTAPKNGSWLVNWECDQASPKNIVQRVNCSATEAKGKTPRWECRKREN